MMLKITNVDSSLLNEYCYSARTAQISVHLPVPQTIQTNAMHKVHQETVVPHMSHEQVVGGTGPWVKAGFAVQTRHCLRVPLDATCECMHARHPSQTGPRTWEEADQVVHFGVQSGAVQLAHIQEAPLWSRVGQQLLPHPPHRLLVPPAHGSITVKACS